MVLLHVKRGDESQFLLQAPGSTELEELTVQVAQVYNARLKVQRICSGAAPQRLKFATWDPGPLRVREGGRNGAVWNGGSWAGPTRLSEAGSGRGSSL